MCLDWWMSRRLVAVPSIFGERVYDIYREQKTYNLKKEEGMHW